jgi:DHA1 family arabinose polymer transporter-like MFS transporter
MTEVAGFPANMITIIMIIAGIGMAAGNFLGGRLADKYSPLKTTGTLLLSMVLCLLVVSLVSRYKLPAILLTFVTGAIAFAVISPMQMLMIKAAKGSEMLASSAIQASANMGNALGAYLGGLPIIAGYGYSSPEYVGADLAFTGVIFCMVLLFKKQSPVKNNHTANGSSPFTNYFAGAHSVFDPRRKTRQEQHPKNLNRNNTIGQTHASVGKP